MALDGTVAAFLTPRLYSAEVSRGYETESRFLEALQFAGTGTIATAGGRLFGRRIAIKRGYDLYKAQAYIRTLREELEGLKHTGLTEEELENALKAIAKAKGDVTVKEILDLKISKEDLDVLIKMSKKNKALKSVKNILRKSIGEIMEEEGEKGIKELAKKLINFQEEIKSARKALEDKVNKIEKELEAPKNSDGAVKTQLEGELRRYKRVLSNVEDFDKSLKKSIINKLQKIEDHYLKTGWKQLGCSAVGAVAGSLSAMSVAAVSSEVWPTLEVRVPAELPAAAEISPERSILGDHVLNIKPSSSG